MELQLQLLEEILKKVNRIDNNLETASPLNSNVEETHAINWTLSKTDLIELIYALHSGGAFNKGTASIAQITRFFESVLHIQLGNTSMTFQEILRRKDSAAFLERLKEKLNEHIERIDERNLR